MNKPTGFHSVYFHISFKKNLFLENNKVAERSTTLFEKLFLVFRKIIKY